LVQENAYLLPKKLLPSDLEQKAVIVGTKGSLLKALRLLVGESKLSRESKIVAFRNFYFILYITTTKNSKQLLQLWTPPFMKYIQNGPLSIRLRIGTYSQPTPSD
jgi:hypothetical protein